MNEPHPKVMPPTIEEHFNLPAGSIERFAKKKDDYLASIEAERKERVRATRKAAWDRSWAA